MEKESQLYRRGNMKKRVFRKKYKQIASEVKQEEKKVSEPKKKQKNEIYQ